jgi:hypothetical protein
MKKLFIIALLGISGLTFAQDEDNKKFQVGVSYSVTSDDALFDNPLSVYANYQIKNWDRIGLDVGMRVFYFKSTASLEFSNKWAFNPTVSSSYAFKNSKLKGYLALGYYFDSFEFSSNNVAGPPIQNLDITSNGVTVTPGLKYFVHKNIFLDTNITLLFATQRDSEFFSESTNTFFNIGLGVAF